VTPDYHLIAGRRRLAAYAHLGRATIPARVLDLDKLLTAEFHENEHRKDLNPSERVAIVQALADQLSNEAKERRRAGWQKRGQQPEPSVNVTEDTSPQPQVRDAAAAAVGWSGPTYAKAKAVVDAATAEPALQPLVDMMDQTGNVSAAYRQLPREPRPAGAKAAARDRQVERERWLHQLLYDLMGLYPWPMGEDGSPDQETDPEDGPELQACVQALVADVFPQDGELIDGYFRIARLVWAALDAAWQARMQAQRQDDAGTREEEAATA
jgi:hypothetical protein